MPCMSQKKDKDLAKSQRDASASTAKKLIDRKPALITTKMRANGRQRDVGT